VTTVAVQAQRADADPQAVFDQATRDFLNQDIVESANGFDELVTLAPNFKPRLWQRGIVLYYAGRYDDCREQFESHRTVNPNDVENAAWHFLCVARAESPEEARSALLPVGPDARVPMREVYGLLSGSRTAEDVMAATGGAQSAEFFAHLYVGLHAEALGNPKQAIEHIRAAASDDYAAVGGFMHAVARVHLALHPLGR
jgi:tetratricopeptide (TPR) repeat protein